MIVLGDTSRITNAENDDFVNEQRIENAKSLLISQGYSVYAPDDKVTLLLHDEVKDDAIRTVVDMKNGLGIGISFDGYSDFNSSGDSGTPVFIEKYNDALRVLIYNDIEKDEPSHIITLDGARTQQRKTN